MVIPCQFFRFICRIRIFPANIQLMIKPKLLKVDSALTASFDIRHEQVAYFDNPWHYHPELELTLVTKSTGIRFVGDCVEQFAEGDLVLLGSNLPHYWHNNEAFYQAESILEAEAYILRFKPQMMNNMLDMPEALPVRQLLDKAVYGIWFAREVADKIKTLMVKLLHSDGTQRIIGFLEIMHCLSMTDGYRVLSTSTFANSKAGSDLGRVGKVLSYINSHIKEDISLDTIARHVNMNPTAFCRYIKAHTNKTFIELLTDIRISNACRLLLARSLSISGIAYECGFRNTTHFNYVFKKSKKLTPSQYRSKWSGT